MKSAWKPLACPAISTGTWMDLLSSETVILVLPFLRGRKIPRGEMSAVFVLMENFTIRVTSTVSPDSSRAVTRSWA